MTNRRKLRRRLKNLYQKYLEFSFSIRRKFSKNPNDLKSYLEFLKKRRGEPPRPFSETMQYLRKKKQAFLEDHHAENTTGILMVPEVFSLHLNYEETIVFIKRLYLSLDSELITTVVIDYDLCKTVSADAFALLDAVLDLFLAYQRRCDRIGRKRSLHSLDFKNWRKPEIEKVMFTIGSIRNFLKIEKEFKGITPLPFLIGNKGNYHRGATREIHITKTVDYLEHCLHQMGHALDPKQGKQLYDILGEIYANAEEHGTLEHRYSLGFFQEDQNELDEILGSLNFVVFNFGKTIYEVFSSPDCPNKENQARMKELSESYTKSNWFSKREFEEETLWTLYALQEGVTSHKDWQRGHGTITFLDRFFKLKGSHDPDNQSVLMLFSGHCQIIFDGTFGLIEKERLGKNGKVQKVKMMTFNEFNDIEKQPDKRFVKFATEFFPGTLITAKIILRKVSTP